MPAGPMAMDPEYYRDPQTFSATRFSGNKGSATELVTEKSQRMHEFVRFTCPGRWYASAVMKIIIAQIILKYDVKFPERQRERLPNVYLDLIVEPNPKQVVHFRLKE
jgi:cytochrome P450